MNGPNITWNDQLRMVMADVDETIADVYTPAEPAMIDELSSFLADGYKLFMVSGGSLQRIRTGITDLLLPKVRSSILVSHCSGAEVWGFTKTGELRDQPFYSHYEKRLTTDHQHKWRDIIQQLITEFSLRPYPAQPKPTFWGTIGRDPQDFMLDDRGPQITFEMVNSIDLNEEQLAKLDYEVPLTKGKHDLRIAIMERSIELFEASDVPITPRLGGIYALDFAIKGVSKTSSIQAVMQDENILHGVGLKPHDVSQPEYLEIWGDRFSEHHGSDHQMCKAVSPRVRAVDFREEDASEFPKGFNIQIWNGKYHLHDGLLEYLQSRKN